MAQEQMPVEACACIESPRFQERLRTSILADLCIGYRLEPSILCQVWEPRLISRFGFEHPASTLPTRFPAALGIEHGQPAA